MSARKDGGPAFPVAGPYGPFERGMSLRDYFAGEALAHILVNDSHAWKAREIARGAYDLADAMLAARKEVRHD